MNFELFSQSLSITVCIIFTVLSFYVIISLYKPTKEQKIKSKAAKARYKKTTWLQFGAVLLLSIMVALILDPLTGHYTETPMPASFIVMCLPATVLFSVLLLAVYVKKRLRILAALAFGIGILFSLVIINNYYRYYPTFGSVFGRTNARLLRNTNNVTLKYTVSQNQGSLNEHSVQGSLANLTSQPTAGQIYQINIPGTVSKFKARPAFVYVPAIYRSLQQLNLPVIILTAGVPGSPNDWVSLGLDNIMNQFAKSHGGIAPLVFVVDSTGSINNDTECVNSPRGNVETYLSVDVPNYIKHNFHVDDSPKNWAIGGLSLGGMCAVMLTLRHPNVFNYFIDLGGEVGPEVGSKQQTVDALFGGSEQDWAAHQPSLLLAKNSYPSIGGFFGDGNQDSLQVEQAIAQLSTESKQAGIDSVTETINGAHTFNVWTQTYTDALPWISNRIGATQCSSSCI
jgi:S-formylglutathione hydrolase FrmB